MTPEELKEIRSTLEFASQAGAKDEFMDTTFNLLEFIDEQAAQIEALKEKLVEERAITNFGGESEGQDYHANFSELPEDRDDEIAHGKRFPTSKSGYKKIASQQLAADPDLQKAGVGWE